MAQELKARGTSFQLHYSDRTAVDMAYRERLAMAFPEQLRLYCTRAYGGSRIDLASIMRSAATDAMFYVCGPGRLITAVRTVARDLDLPAERIQIESFE